MSMCLRKYIGMIIIKRHPRNFSLPFDEPLKDVPSLRFKRMSSLHIQFCHLDYF